MPIKCVSSMLLLLLLLYCYTCRRNIDVLHIIAGAWIAFIAHLVEYCSPFVSFFLSSPPLVTEVHRTEWPALGGLLFNYKRAHLLVQSQYFGLLCTCITILPCLPELLLANSVVACLLKLGRGESSDSNTD